MGFSVSASTAIIFVGLFLALGILYPAVSNGWELVDDAEVDRDDAQLDMRNSEINITDVENTEISVKNEGSTTLNANKTDLLVNGSYQDREEYETTVVEDDNSDTELWQPGETLRIDPNDNFNNGARIRFVTDHGLSVTGEI